MEPCITIFEYLLPIKKNRYLFYLEKKHAKTFNILSYLKQKNTNYLSIILIIFIYIIT